MNRMRDISGQTFGELTAISIDGKDSTGKTVWKCICRCGAETRATMLNLTKGTTKSCGHLRRVSRRLDLTGHSYGKLTVLEPLPKQRWRCRCECGKVTNVQTGHIRSGHTQSCGRCTTTIKTDTLQARLDTREWIKAVKVMRRCDACGSRDRLHAHHIMPFAQYPEMRTFEDNGACLCVSCHGEVHRLIRRGSMPGDALAEVLAPHCQYPEIIKYLMRAGSKGEAAEDYAKAQHYLDKLGEVLACGGAS